MERAQSHAPLRVIKSPSRLNRQPKIKSAKAAKNNYSNFAATAVLAVAGTLLALSLSHLAAGIALVTGAGPSDGWLMAIGIDLGFIALELAVLVAPADKRAAGVRYAAPAIVRQHIEHSGVDLYLDEGCRDALDRCMTSRVRINPGRNAISLHF